MAARSWSGRRAVLRTIETIGPLTLTKFGVSPVFSMRAKSPADHPAIPVGCGVMFGAASRPSGLGPPAYRRSSMMAPAALRALWHSAQCPGPWTR